MRSENFCIGFVLGKLSAQLDPEWSRVAVGGLRVASRARQRDDRHGRQKRPAEAFVIFAGSFDLAHYFPLPILRDANAEQARIGDEYVGCQRSIVGIEE